MTNAVYLWTALGTALPLVVALCTKRETKAGVQGVFFTVLAAGAGFAEAYVKARTGHTAFNVHNALSNAFRVFAVGQAAHLAVWKSTGVSKFLQNIGSRAEKLVNEVPANVREDILTEVRNLAEAALQKIDANAKVVAQANAVVAKATAPVGETKPVDAPVVPDLAADVAVPDLTDADLDTPAELS